MFRFSVKQLSSLENHTTYTTSKNIMKNVRKYRGPGVLQINPLPPYFSPMTAMAERVKFKAKEIINECERFLQDEPSSAVDELKKALGEVVERPSCLDASAVDRLTLQHIQELNTESSDDVIGYLKTREFVTQAREVQLATLDGKVDFPLESFTVETREVLATSKTCIGTSSKSQNDV